MIESEAIKRWCPFARVVEQCKAVAAHNRVQGESIPVDEVGLPNGSKCLGSACMAWRWSQKRNPDWKPDTSGWAGPGRHPADTPPLYVEDREHGYCGLAGRAP